MLRAVECLKGNFRFIFPYLTLLKPRVISLVIFTGVSGVVCSSGVMHPFLFFMYLLALVMGSGAAGAINMWYDRDIDALMSRTSSRPIPAGIVRPDSALDFAVVLSFFSVFIIAVTTNIWAALMLAFSIGYYVFVYTFLLKRNSVHSTLLGGFASSLTPIISNLAVDSRVEISGVILAAIIFFWTPPHFFALSFIYRKDYELAGIPVMPCVYGIKRTKKQLLIFSWIVFAVVFLPCFFVKNPFLYSIVALLFNIVWMYKAFALCNSEEVRLYYSFFFYSIMYLFGIFSAVMFFSIFTFG